MAKQTTEEELNLRRQARRRLIGAIALVLLAVFLLPVVFDNEPAPTTGNNIELRIPNKDNAGEFQPKINLPELDKMASEAVAASSVANALARSPEVAPASNSSTPKLESKSISEVKPKAITKPAKQQSVPKTGWVVQVGAFANADTAKSLQAKLKKLGYRAYTERTGNVVRVRAGSYSSLDAVEKAKGKLEAQGMQANVVNLEQVGK